MNSYYSEKLSANRLKCVYDIASPRARRYLNAEIEHALSKIKRTDSVLELGCGYGRILKRIIKNANSVWGIDNSQSNLSYAQIFLESDSHVHLAAMNACELGFHDRIFDVVLCLQNGLSAFKVNQQHLINEAIRVTKEGGVVLFSSYSDKFWDDRLEWFQAQADCGLIGEIDYQATKNGIIVCKDGFRATTISADDFIVLSKDIHPQIKIREIDDSSIFCEIHVV